MQRARSHFRPRKGRGRPQLAGVYRSGFGRGAYLRALVVAGAFPNVFAQDPITLTGDTRKAACSGDATLDLLTTGVMLPRPTAANPQSLTGQYVQLEDVNPPNVVPPSVSNPPGDFTSVASGNKFAATNAYYHVDFLYNLMEQFAYHVGTTFPMPVDQSDLAPRSNQRARREQRIGTGAGESGFGAVDTRATTRGMAADFRVVMHEFCHNPLWNRVHSPNFGVSHVNDADGYSSEQILSTTHFRIYRSCAGTTRT